MTPRRQQKNESSDKQTSGQPLPVISLFCGAGGLDLGFVQAGFRPVLALDKDDSACVTYAQNHPSIRVIKRDFRETRKGYILERLSELPETVRPVGVIGGPPCQAFSQGNQNGGKADKRADLPNYYADILKELAKRFELDFFVFENVLGLKHERHLDLFKAFKRLFASAGFTIFEGELDAQDFDVAQVRKRLFVVGFNRRKYPHLEFEFPEPPRSQVKTVGDVIRELPKPVFFKRGLRPETFPVHLNHWCMRPRSDKFSNGYLKEGDIKGRPFRVLNWDKPSWTVAYGHREVHVHPSGRRRLSVYEAMLLQGFPPDYRLCGTLSGQIRLVSDAVPPPLANGLAKSIREVIESGTQTMSLSPEHSILWTSRDKGAHTRLRTRLKGFFVRYGRRHFQNLPWRKKHVSVFQLLVAESLLVQTKAADVARVWPQIIKKYPTPKALAGARRPTLIRMLSTLGLQNQRVTSLKTIAKTLVETWRGNVPRRIDNLLSIPYVGLYTATAVACFKFGKRLPIVDANVLRVLGRLTGASVGKDIRRSKEIWAYAWALLPKQRSDLHNYGLLDFAAQVCTVRNPGCMSCPLNRTCAFGRKQVRIQTGNTERPS